jgi:hypothetical protein
VTRRSELIRCARRLGWRAEQTNGGHVRLTHPDSDTPIIASSTPGCSPWRQNALADMRRALRARNGPAPDHRGE